MLLHVTQVVLVVKSLPAKAGDVRDEGSSPGLGRFPGGGKGNPLQQLCLESLMGRRTWRLTVHRVAESQTRLQWFSNSLSTLEIQSQKQCPRPASRCQPGPCSLQRPGDILTCSSSLCWLLAVLGCGYIISFLHLHISFSSACMCVCVCLLFCLCQTSLQFSFIRAHVITLDPPA